MAAQDIESEVTWTRGPGFVNLSNEALMFRKMEDAANSYGDAIIPNTWEEASEFIRVFDEKVIAKMSSYPTVSVPAEYQEFPADTSEQLTCPVSVYRPLNQSGPLPCVIELHPGGMCMLTGREGVFRNICEGVAVDGYVVIQPHFTNAHVEPFPRGLNDCLNAIRWANENREALQIDNTPFLMQGASGGANLSLACAMSLKGEMDLLGLWLECPYFFQYHDIENIPENLPSFIENQGCDGNPEYSPACKLVYTWNEEDQVNPLAWPYFATVSDLEGLCPIYMNENECALYRDATIAVYRKLQKAKVKSVLKVDYGSFHGSDDYNRGNAMIKWAGRMECFKQLVKEYNTTKESVEENTNAASQ